MDVQLYVYDLTHGMARQMSRQFLGIQIDAVYHTSLVFGNIEYFFGAGVQTSYPGQTHHGRPMEIISLGTTQLPLETILEYLDGLKEIYTPESYDLFAHNCNNFTNDFAMFLIGRGIPDHITSLPKRVLETPFGQMLKPQIDASMRQVTQAPVAPQNVPHSARKSGAAVSKTSSGSTAVNGNGVQTTQPYGGVVNVTDLGVLEKQLKNASATATTIFFTSSTCGPCKLAYPTYDSLAEQYPHALFIKTDINEARDIASRYQIRATPTFITFSKGTKQEEWTGADPSLLKANVERLLNHTFPPHPHSSLRVPTLQYGSMKPITYAKPPPLSKVLGKLGKDGKDPGLVALGDFLQKRGEDPREATLPNLTSISQTFKDKVINLSLEIRFAAVDLLRAAMVDPRVSGFFAEEQHAPMVPLLIQSALDMQEDCPHDLRLVTVHLACNLFASPLYVAEILKTGSEMPALLIQLVTLSLLDNTHPTVRVAAASLAFNIATVNYKVRREESREALAEGEQVELAASLIQTIAGESSIDAARMETLALGYLVYFSPIDGDLMDLCRAMDAAAAIDSKEGYPDLFREVKSLVK